MVEYLSKADLIYLNQQVVTAVNGQTYGVLSDSSLEMIVEQPQQIVFGQELYPSIWLKAAFILQKIAKKHAFRDGNKRTAIMASLVFLSINGYQPISEEVINNSDDFVLSVTNSPDTEDTMLEIAKWLELVHEKI
ncbi:death-on-curing family protein [Bacilli bacterium]|nr:death-on-curing family protein [Bacilli bacterium]